MTDLKFRIGDHVKTISSNTPGIVIKSYRDVLNGKELHHYTVHCLDTSSIMVCDEKNLDYDENYYNSKNTACISRH